MAKSRIVDFAKSSNMTKLISQSAKSRSYDTQHMHGMSMRDEIFDCKVVESIINEM